MWEIRVVHVGRFADRNLGAAASRYAAMVGGEWRLRLDPVAASSRKEPDRVRREEGERLLQRAPREAYRVALDPAGEPLDSPAFGRLLSTLKDAGRRVVFLVGGAHGLSREVREGSHQVLSLSPMTLPHEMAVLLLAEQIYRAFAASTGRPYAK